MKYKISHRPEVKSDIIKAVDYYKNINPELAKEFLYRIREAKEYIIQVPFGFQIKYKEVRTLLLKQFPYHIHYIIDTSTNEIIILAIIHAYKNPADYTGR